MIKIKIVKLNITFSQPLFSKLTVERMLDRDSLLPLDWRKIRVVKIIDKRI